MGRANQNATGYIGYQCCHQLADRAPLMIYLGVIQGVKQMSERALEKLKIPHRRIIIKNTTNLFGYLKPIWQNKILG